MGHYEIIAIILSAIAGLFKNPRISTAIFVLVNFFFLLAYFELGLYMACISLAVTGLRGVAALLLSEEHNKYSVFISTSIVIVLISLQIEHMADILIVFAAVMLGLTAYFRDHLVYYWLATLGSQALWITHSLIFDVYGMLICCAVITLTGLYALIKNTEFKLLRAKFKLSKNDEIIVAN